MWKVLLAEPLDAAADARLAAAAEVVRPASGDEDGLIAAIADCDALVARTNTPVTARVLAAGVKLRCVGVAGVGVDRVDLTAARQRAITVLHTPAASSDAVAELTVSLMLQLVRPTQHLVAQYRAGQFREARAAAHGVELCTLTVGIIGFGRIGSRVGRICAAGIGAQVQFTDIIEIPPPHASIQQIDLEALLRTSDIVTLHTPLTPLTRGMIGAAQLAAMKSGAWLVNAARGACVDTEALADALQSGKLAGAALDVTEPEPLAPRHRLLSMSNCIVTPHIAARTYGGLQRMYAVADDVIAFLKGS